MLLLMGEEGTFLARLPLLVVEASPLLPPCKLGRTLDRLRESFSRRQKEVDDVGHTLLAFQP
jgi:hypothetical protein